MLQEIIDVVYAVGWTVKGFTMILVTIILCAALVPFILMDELRKD
jgi:hypothetical protein